MPGRQIAATTTTPGEKVITSLLAAVCQIVVDGLARLLRDLELDRAPRLSLADGGSVDGVAMRRNVADPEPHEIAPSEFAIHGEVEKGEVARSSCQL